MEVEQRNTSRMIYYKIIRPLAILRARSRRSTKNSYVEFIGYFMIFGQ